MNLKSRIEKLELLQQPDEITALYAHKIIAVGGALPGETYETLLALPDEELYRRLIGLMPN